MKTSSAWPRVGFPFRQISAVTLVSASLISLAGALRAETPASGIAPDPPVLASGATPQSPIAPCQMSSLGTPFIPLDSWVYPSLARLYSLGYLDSAFLGLRPWTRLSVIHMLELTGAKLEDANEGPDTDEARKLYDALWHELNPDAQGPCFAHQGHIRYESTYTVLRGISGTPLHDSYHLGETVVNDYGRPVESGFDNYSGASGYATAGPFTLYARTEFQYAPSAAGYSQSLFDSLSTRDRVPFATNPVQETIPLGPIGAKTNFRVMEAYVSAHEFGHEFSFGKMDEWMSPAQGGAYAYSNNAENIYSFQINRVEPLHVPGLSRVTGPFRYQFLVGSLKGHTDFNDPWVHAEKISFKPTPDLEFGFERTVIWGGKGHVPITIHSFLKSFFSVQNVSESEKLGRGDPGARFGAFDMTYRLPYLRNWLTFFVDSDAHDDVSPISAPRRADNRPGLYLSHVPGLPKLDLRVESSMTDLSTAASLNGGFTYYETEVKQGYTNAGQIFGDWMGREAKGGQAWVTWHLSGNEFIQASWRGQKAAKDFIIGGTTIDDVSVKVVKRLTHELEVNASFTDEKYLIPEYLKGRQNVTNTSVQITWYPGRRTSF
jgi:hypothetical protein